MHRADFAFWDDTIRQNGESIHIVSTQNNLKSLRIQQRRRTTFTVWIVACGLYSFFSIAHLIVLPEPSKSIMFFVAGYSAVISTLACLYAYRVPSDEVYDAFAIVLLSLLVTTNVTAHGLIVHDTTQMNYLLVLAGVMPILAPTQRSAIVVQAIALAGATILIARGAPPPVNPARLSSLRSDVLRLVLRRPSTQQPPRVGAGPGTVRRAARRRAAVRARQGRILGQCQP
jgi:hypothetical protein